MPIQRPCIIFSSLAALGLGALAWLLPPIAQGDEAVPVICDYRMDPVPGHPDRVQDAGPAHADLTIHGRGISVVPGRQGGHALMFAGAHGDRAISSTSDILNRVGHDFTVTTWVRIAALPHGGKMAILAKRTNGNVGTPFILGIDEQGRFATEGTDGASWPANVFSDAHIQPMRWYHLAFVWKSHGPAVHYCNGVAILTFATHAGLATTAEPLVFGYDDYSHAPFHGWIGRTRIYPIALTAPEIVADRDDTLRTRPAVASDFAPPTQTVHLHLTRYDMPIGERSLRDGNFDPVTRQDAIRRGGPDAVDWPHMTLDGKPCFAQAVENHEMPLIQGDRMRPLLRQPTDDVIEPGDHWLRVLEWIWNQKHVYTTDPTANGFGAEYELEAFPLRVAGPGAADVREVTVEVAGSRIYQLPAKGGPLHSLTLLLVANAPGIPYGIRVNGSQPVMVTVGLEPLVSGHPDERMIMVDAAVPGSAPAIRLTTPAHPGVFPNQGAWNRDVAAMAQVANGAMRLTPLNHDAPRNWAGRVGVEVPRSPVSINGVDMRAGMSAGWLYDHEHLTSFPGHVDAYAAHCADLGFDAVFAFDGGVNDPRDPDNIDHLMDALAAHGLRGGVSPSEVNCPNIAFFMANLPTFYRTCTRDLALVAQRFRNFPAFLGIIAGADNGGYISYWDWAGPIMNRPWARAWLTWQGSPGKGVPLGPALQPSKDLERRGTERAFIDYIHGYDRTFSSGYGALAAAVADVDPAVIYANGSFGSSPGVGSSGGWPWATMPECMDDGVHILQAYDWNEMASSLPMHNVALIDRLQSAHPGVPTWTIIDNFGLFFGRESLDRAYVLALTRGLTGIGTNSLAHTAARPEAQSWYRELHAWIHRFAGVYAMTRPLPTIGILYDHDQAISRPVKAGAIDGCHEGKVTEALFLCHAAGFPARVVTTEELARGPLPSSIKALLLVGLNRFDRTWIWSDGFEAPLRAFAARGGRILRDTETVCPVASVNTGMVVRSYVAQSDQDQTPLLFSRNAGNIVRLRAAMKGIVPPVVTSDDPSVWAIPTMAGDVEFVTVVNQGVAKDGAGHPISASTAVRGQIAHLAWSTHRPIYDLRSGTLVDPLLRGTTDLSHESFQFYALPKETPVAPKMAITPSMAGPYQVALSATCADGSPMAGLPVRLVIERDGTAVTLHSATGLTAALPITAEDGGATYTITATELLSSLHSTITVHVPSPAAVATAIPPPIPASDRGAIRTFLHRQAPLIVALTPEQAADPAVSGAATRLVAALTRMGRRVLMDQAAPNRVVLSLQLVRGPLAYPHWRTVDADLILIGDAAHNPLIFDQTRAYLLPAEAPPAGHARIVRTLSPFIGGREVVNILAADDSGATAGIDALIAAGGR